MRLCGLLWRAANGRRPDGENETAVGVPKPHPTKPLPPPWIPLSFFATALCTLGSGFVWLLCGEVQSLALLHLLVVGVFAMVAMGALYQFVPVVGMARLRLPQLAALHLALAICGTTAVVFGFQTRRFEFVTAGGAAVAAGVLVEGLVLHVTVRGAPIAFPARFAALALTWLAATVLTGTIIGAQMIGASLPQALLHAHPILGLAGFYGTIITAVSFRLLRMFERVDEERRAPLRVAGLAAAALIALVPIRYALIALALVAAVLVYDILDIARRRNPAYQRETLWYSSVSFLGALAASIAAVTDNSMLAVEIAVWFFIGSAVVGYLQRIVPFLWWIQRARRNGALNIPSLKDLNHSTLGYAILMLWIAAGLLWLFTGDRAAAAVGLSAWCGLVIQLSRAFLLQRRPSSNVSVQSG